MLSRLPATLELAFAAFFVSTAIGLLLGILSARMRRTFVDLAARVIAIIGQSMPNFWVGIMAILLFAVYLGWLPTSGRMGIQYMILPVATLA